ncbi:tyrosyl-DNA phosphodiesterase 1 [Tachysurus ichikawai]
MESQHGKWTLSDSEDDDDNVIPPTPPKNIQEPLKNIKPDSEPKASPVSTVLKPKSEPRKKNNVKLETEKTSVPAMGSEARQASRLHQSNPVKYDSSPSAALKRKRETDEGGWNLSSSDDDDNRASSSAPKNKPQPKPPGSSPPRKKPERKKPERSRPPSPHGENYYKEEPSDFFEANLNTTNDTYRFYLNKVTGIEKKYNTGALHIKEILSPMFGTLKESVQFNYCFDIPWMVQQYPPEFRNNPVTIVHGEKRESKARLMQQAQPYSHIRFCQAKLDIAFGTHHT